MWFTIIVVCITYAVGVGLMLLYKTHQDRIDTARQRPLYVEPSQPSYRFVVRLRDANGLWLVWRCNKTANCEENARRAVVHHAVARGCAVQKIRLIQHKEIL